MTTQWIMFIMFTLVSAWLIMDIGRPNGDE